MTYYDSVPDTLQHYYKVTAFNNAGISPFSSAASGRRNFQPSMPAAPGQIIASHGSTEF
jgi:hypothetical protein